MRNPLFILFFIVVIWFFFAKESVVTLGPGVLASDPPKQTDIASAQSFAFKDFEVTALAKFQIKAKVLSKENYRWGREADLSPVDLALGWGTMSDESVLDAIEISQSNRWYTWWTDDFPIPRRDIETQSANMHLIPANSDIESLINKARRGDIIEISGYVPA